MTFDEMVNKLLDNGIVITLSKEDGVVWYDLNTEMKSELLIAKAEVGGDATAVYKKRYGESGEIDTWCDLMFTAKQCMHGRDFLHSAWEQLLLGEGILDVKVTSTKTYR